MTPETERTEHTTRVEHSPSHRRQSMRRRTTFLAALPIVLFLFLMSVPTIPGTNIDLTVPYAAEGKGPTVDTLGDVDGIPVVDITGKEIQVDEPSQGHLNMTTVSVRTKMTLLQALTRWVASDDTLVPIEQVIPSGMSTDQVREQNAQAFAASESNATIAAMRYLKKPLETVVVGISKDSPASEALQVNDVILAVDDRKISLPDELAEEVRSHAPGDKISLRIQRQSQEHTLDFTLDKHPYDSVAFLGVTSVAQPAGDISVSYNLTDIGGPSAGLMFSLAVVDKLSPGDLTGGAFVAGTGTINAEGEVGPIGGIRHKIAAAADAGATIFLVPSGNCSEAVGISKKVRDTGIQLVEVDTLEDAVKDLSALSEGKEVSLCS